MEPNAELKIETLTSIVRDSAAANAPRPTKRGRGRPRKDGAPNRADLKNLGLESDPLASAPPPGSTGGASASGPDTTGSAGPAGPEVLPPEFEIPTEMLKMALSAPFTLMRVKTGYPGFHLPDEVAEQCAPLAKACLDKYLPGMLNSEHRDLIMLTATLGSVAFVQYRGYLEWKHETLHAASPPPRRPEQGQTNFAGAGDVPPAH